MKGKQISTGRKSAYYIGMGMIVVGVLAILSTFISTATRNGSFHGAGNPPYDLGGIVRDVSDDSEPVRAAVGFVLAFIGMILLKIGEKGLAGSGVILNPEKTRKDLEPWARMGGGVIKDALEEAGVNLEKTEKHSAELPFDEQLRRLHKLCEDGIISNEEYQEKKKRILEK